MLRPRRRRRRRRAICRNPTACLPSRSCLHLRFLTDSPTCVPHYYATVGRSFAHARTRRTQKSVGRGRSVSPRTRPSHDLMTVTIAPIGSALGPSTRSVDAVAMTVALPALASGSRAGRSRRAAPTVDVSVAAQATAIAMAAATVFNATRQPRAEPPGACAPRSHACRPA